MSDKSTNDVLPTVQKIIAQQLKVEPSVVVPEAELQKDLGAESLDAMEIIMNIEEAFDIDVPDDQARKVQTVGDIIGVVKAQLKSASS